MKNKESIPNKFLFKPNEDNISFQQKAENNLTLIPPPFFFPQPKIFSSNISDKMTCEGNNSGGFCKISTGIDFDIVGHALFRGMYPSLGNWALNPPSKFQTRISNGSENGNNMNNFNFEPKNIFLNKFEQEEFFKEKKDENKNKINQNNNGNCNYLYNFLNGPYNLKERILSPEKNINLNLNTDINTPKTDNRSTNGTGAKFFTNHNYGYKCSCSKTQCNRKYCECFNSGNYCIDCNCKNCNNKPPVNSYTNKHPIDESSKNKKNKIICTCTKSGCNKNYCECFKNGQKCSSLCRCISCENNDNIINRKNNINNNYECCPENSIFIIKNNITIEDIKIVNTNNIIGNEENNNIELSPAPARKENYMNIAKKRKREETKDSEEFYEKKNKISKISEEIDLFNDSLFDKKGKVILSHINLIHIQHVD